MAFWGIEVKAGRPFTHKPDTYRGIRLHVSQATLGSGGGASSTSKPSGKTVVQCNVGSKTPLFLCSLFPEKSESCQLNLEFQETEDVIFSVVGPHSVHLTGYYLDDPPSNRHRPDDQSESFGEDIADTATEQSADTGEEDKYEDSFIDDDEPEIMPLSPLSSDHQDVGITKNKKSKKIKGSQRRLKKYYQVSESEDDSATHQTNLVNGIPYQIISDGENEDMLPISSLSCRKPVIRSTRSVAEEAYKREKADSAANSEAHRQLSRCNSDLSPKVHFESNTKLGMKSKELTKEKLLETGTKDDFFSGSILKWDKPKLAERVGEKSSQNLPVVGENNNSTRERGDKPSNSSFHPIDLDPGVVSKPKKKNKEQKKAVENTLEDDSPHCNIAKGDKGEETQKKADDKKAELLEKSNPTSPQLGHKDGVKKKRKRKEITSTCSLELDAANHSKLMEMQESKPNELEVDSINHEHNETIDLNVENQSADKDHPRKKKKRKERAQENGEPSNVEISPTSMDKGKRSNMVIVDNNTGYKPSDPKTLSGGLVIDDLEMGKPNGKIALPGKKISVRYTCKLKESEEVLHSNIDGHPLKFRLGDQDVSDFWNVGLQGMRIGNKRRLIVPPSMSHGVEVAKEIPPNSWLVYDVELLKVR